MGSSLTYITHILRQLSSNMCVSAKWISHLWNSVCWSSLVPIWDSTRGYNSHCSIIMPLRILTMKIRLEDMVSINVWIWLTFLNDKRINVVLLWFKCHYFRFLVCPFHKILCSNRLLLLLVGLISLLVLRVSMIATFTILICRLLVLCNILGGGSLLSKPCWCKTVVFLRLRLRMGIVIWLMRDRILIMRKCYSIFFIFILILMSSYCWKYLIIKRTRIHHVKSF